LGAGRRPSPVSDRVVTLAASLCLQWRDRAGISPDFPFKPKSGTVGCLSCTTLAAVVGGA
jgi:hypothetical protein